MAQAPLLCLFPQNSVQAVFCHLLTQLPLPQPILQVGSGISTVEMLPKCRVGIFPGELDPVAAPWGSLCQISSDEGFITVQHLHFPVSSEISFMAPGAVGLSSLHLPSFPNNLNRLNGMGLGCFLYRGLWMLEENHLP